MRVDFYVLGANRPESVVVALAARALGQGERLLIVAAAAERRAALSKALWEARPEQFLAHGDADAPHAECQPILLSDRTEAVNGASLLCLADGGWRDSEGFARVLYLVDDDGLAEARGQWKRLGECADVERRFWKQDEGGRWIEGP